MSTFLHLRRGRNAPEWAQKGRWQAMPTPGRRRAAWEERLALSLYQDVDAAIYRIKSGEAGGLRAVPTGDTETLLDILCLYDTGGSSDPLGTFIHKTAVAITWAGQLTAELVRRPTECSEGPHFVLAQLSGPRVHLFGPIAVQIKSKRDESGNSKPRLAFGSRRNIAVFSTPAALGGIAGHRRRLSTLAQVGPLFPRYSEDRLVEHLRDGFEDSHYHWYRDVYVAQAMGPWGSAYRTPTPSAALDYWKIDRTIEFNFAVAALVEGIVNELNRLLRFEGVEAQVEIEGLPSAATIQNIREELRHGSISFGEAISRSRLS